MYFSLKLIPRIEENAEFFLSIKKLFQVVLGSSYTYTTYFFTYFFTYYLYNSVHSQLLGLFIETKREIVAYCIS